MGKQFLLGKWPQFLKKFEIKSAGLYILRNVIDWKNSLNIQSITLMCDDVSQTQGSRGDNLKNKFMEMLDKNTYVG